MESIEFVNIEVSKACDADMIHGKVEKENFDFIYGNPDMLASMFISSIIENMGVQKDFPRIREDDNVLQEFCDRYGAKFMAGCKIISNDPTISFMELFRLAAQRGYFIVPKMYKLEKYDVERSVEENDKKEEL